MALCLPAVPSSAQDVIVGKPGWFAAKGVPEIPPRFRHRPYVSYPRELRHHDASGTGYVLVTVYLDAGGTEDVAEMSDAYPWFRQAVEDHGRWSMHPARDHGKPVPSWFWVPIIFNPAAADRHRADAIPRLLAVTPVIVPAAMMRRLPGAHVLWGTVKVDAAGHPSGVAMAPGAPERILPAVEHALRHWRFAPARQRGRPVAGALRLAFIFHAPVAPIPRKMQPPRVVSQEQPVYPYALRRSGIIGRVKVGFVVNTKGGVVDPVVMDSNGPDFNEAAVEAVLKWKFRPARVNGHAVSTRMVVPIIFRFDDGRGRESYTMTSMGKKAREKLPEAFRYDVAPRPRGVIRPVFPYAAFRAGLEGRAAAILEIGPEGRVVALKITKATRPEFGLALAAAVETYVFYPAQKDGRPTPAVVKTQQEFSLNFETGLVTDEDWRLLRLEKKHPDKIAGAGHLDQPLHPLSRQPPVFPLVMVGKADRGTATIEMLVDKDGHARLPRIVKASAPAFGYAAVQAVSQWLFAPPKSHGKSVVVRVEVPFEFDTRPVK